MNKVVILEGPDGSGKTTLAQHLVNKHGFHRSHEGPPPAKVDKLHYYAGMLLEAHQHTKPIVFDRFHLGELVYAPIKRMEPGLNYAELRLMHRIIMATATRMVLCCPPYETAFKNWELKLKNDDDYLRD